MESLKQAFLSKDYAGIIGITALFGLVVSTEIGSSIIGEDFGAFLYTTFHFIVNPLIGLVVIVLTIWHGINAKKALIKTIDFTACLIPVAIIHSGVTGSFWLSDFLKIKF